MGSSCNYSNVTLVRVDVSERSFVLVFSVPKDMANLATSDDVSEAARMAHDQLADWYGQSLEELRQQHKVPQPSSAASGSMESGRGRNGNGESDGGSSEFVRLSVDVVCDNLWTYEMLLSGFSLVKTHYSDLINSPQMGKLKDISGPREHEGAFGDDKGSSINSCCRFLI